MFAFFVALGAFKPAQALGPTDDVLASARRSRDAVLKRAVPLAAGTSALLILIRTVER